ncbi:MAG: UDP-3-O-acyl-N-acetylglucosamine deacetylase, partial [Deferribacteraceae bacterium]|nr:UDP-3-O-acyl-N-acetylglucosamine deacetylase [Deferribacteraceae bacterium]
MYQTTLTREFSFHGVGLHCGRDISVVVSPAAENMGIVFARSDVKNSPYVRTTAFNVTSTQLATTISCGDFPISTIEHLLSALYGLGIDNAKISVEGAEIPILDGSSQPIAEMIKDAGITPQRAKRKYLK